MIAKCIKGKGFRGAAEYDLQPHKSILLESNMAGENPRELAMEFGAVRAVRPNLSKAVCHVSLSIHPDETLTDNQWRETAHAWLDGMGFTNNQYIISRHTDAVHPHIHILVNRITMDGRVVSDAHDYKRQEPIMRKMELNFNLRQVTPSNEIGRKAPTKGEVEHAVRTGEPSARMCLQSLIDEALGKETSYTAFSQELRAGGVTIKLNEASTGHISGTSFAIDGIFFKGSKLGKAYTWNSLQQRGLYNENGHVKGNEQQYNKKGEYGTEIEKCTGRTTELGNASGLAETARDAEIAKQRRITENFEKLEQQYKRNSHKCAKGITRGQGLSR